MTGKQPRFLPDVLQAIVDLKDGNGSTQNKILEHIQNIIKERKINPKPRNINVQVKRAIRHGIQNGLIKHRNGKFQLGIQPRDFALFKAFRYMEPLKDCPKCKKGRRGRRRGKKRRGRKKKRGGKKRRKHFSQSDLESGKSDTSDPLITCKTDRKKMRRDSYPRSSKASSGSDQRIRSHRSSKASLPSRRGQRGYQHDEIEGVNHEETYDSYLN